MILELAGVRPEIDPTAWIAPGAQVMGKVRIGPGASVWFGAVLRGDNEWIEIGADTNIQENAVLHTDWGHPVVIGAGCTIGHMAMVHGARIGANSLIGMSATLLNGAVIEENCLIGAAALVTEGKRIPAGHLAMGSPAKVVRPLDAAGIAGLTASAQSYAENARAFRAGLKEI